MGSDNSKDAQLDKYGQLYSVQEKKYLTRTFHTIAGNEESIFFAKDEFQDYISKLKLSISQDVSSGIFCALTGEQVRLVQFKDFIVNTSAILKGTVSQRSTFLCKVCSHDPSILSLQQLNSLLLWFMKVLLTSECAKTVFPQSTSFGISAESSQRMVSYLMKSLQECAAPASKTLSSDDLEKWLSCNPLAIQIFETIFAFIFYHQTLLRDKGTSMPSDLLAFLGIELHPETGIIIPDGLLLPIKIQHPLFRESFSSDLLDQSSLMVLNTFLPHTIRGRLYPLFSSLRHGESFSTFCKALVGCAGPTLLVIRDKNGYVFGGFASIKWQIGPSFIGDPNCFLFRLSPEVGVFLSTGYNKNYMYLEQTAHTLPNGLWNLQIEGMGGQIEYFGLWLSADYGKGYSRAKPKCTTYASPMLSSSEEFEVDKLELWGVGDPVLPEEEENGEKHSILDKDKTATQLLEMAGKKMHSDGLREPDNN